jgi:hypothetical protein
MVFSLTICRFAENTYITVSPNRNAGKLTGCSSIVPRPAVVESFHGWISTDYSCCFDHIPSPILTTKITKDTKVSEEYFFKLRDLRGLRGENLTS